MVIRENTALSYKALFQAVNPNFGARKTAANPNGLRMWFWRPQATDTITHSQGYKTKVTSLIDGGQIFHSIDKLLTNAKNSVLVNMYEIQNPALHPHRSAPPGTPGANKQALIVDKLIALTKQGIKVKVILDNSYDREKQSFHNQVLIDHLKANGVEVLAYPEKGAKISHVKLLIVDGKYAVIGGMNWGNHSAANHDACVMLEGDDVGNLIGDIFKVDYEYSGGDVKTLPQYKTFAQENIKVLTTSQAGSPDGGKNEILEEILDRIDNAQKSIICELFVMTDKIVAEKLIEAHNRLKANNQPGVKLIVDPGLYLKFKNCRPVVDYLKNSGIPVRFYKPDWSKEEKLHAKWGVFDEEELVIGSANWSKVGLQSNSPTDPGFSSQLQFAKGNHEANVFIKSQELCKAFVQQFNYDWSDKKSMPWMTPGDLYRSIPQDVRNTMFGDEKAELESTRFSPFDPDEFNPFATYKNDPNVKQNSNTKTDVKETGIIRKPPV